MHNIKLLLHHHHNQDLGLKTCSFKAQGVLALSEVVGLLPYHGERTCMSL
jgi:hypothetical protein